MRSLLRSFFICALLIAPYTNTLAAQQFVEVRDKKPAGLAEVVRNVAGADVIFIGETHDDPAQHKAELDIIRALHTRKVAIAIGVEMFTPDDQQRLDEWTGGKLDEERFKPVYARNWSYGWELYRDLFIFARDNHIPMIALNVPKGVISRVVAGGPAALKESELPPKISWTLNESQSTYMSTISRQVFGHRPPERLVNGLNAAQALRNSGMAWNIAKYKQKNPKETIVVLAGTWHAVKNGVPEQLAAYGSITYKVILPELPEFNLENATVRDVDFMLMK